MAIPSFDEFKNDPDSFSYDDLKSSLSKKPEDNGVKVNPDAFSYDELKSKLANQPKAGTLGAYGQTIKQAVKGIPAYVNSAIEGATPYDKYDMSDVVQKEAELDQQKFVNAPGANSPVLGGLATEKDIRETAPSLSGSMAGMAPTMAGAAIGSAFGPVGTVVGGLVGGAAGLYGMKRSAENQFVKQNVQKENEDRAAQGLQPLTNDESISLQNRLNESGDTSKIGYSEALPETAGNLAEMAIALTPLGKVGTAIGKLASPLTRAAAMGATKLVGSMATEAGEEELTRQLQNPIMVKHGFPEQGALDTLKQTAIATLPFGGVAGGIGAYQGYKSSGPLANAAAQTSASTETEEQAQANTATGQINANVQPEINTEVNSTIQAETGIPAGQGYTDPVTGEALRNVEANGAPSGVIDTSDEIINRIANRAAEKEKLKAIDPDERVITETFQGKETPRSYNAFMIRLINNGMSFEEANTLFNERYNEQNQQETNEQQETDQATKEAYMGTGVPSFDDNGDIIRGQAGDTGELGAGGSGLSGDANNIFEKDQSTEESNILDSSRGVLEQLNQDEIKNDNTQRITDVPDATQVEQKSAFGQSNGVFDQQNKDGIDALTSEGTRGNSDGSESGIDGNEITAGLTGSGTIAQGQSITDDAGAAQTGNSDAVPGSDEAELQDVVNQPADAETLGQQEIIQNGLQETNEEGRDSAAEEKRLLDENAPEKLGADYTWSQLKNHLKSNYDLDEEINLTSDDGESTSKVGELISEIDSNQDTGNNELLKNVKINRLTNAVTQNNQTIDAAQPEAPRTDTLTPGSDQVGAEKKAEPLGEVVSQEPVKNAKGDNRFSESAAKTILKSSAPQFKNVTEETHDVVKDGDKWQVVPKSQYPGKIGGKYRIGETILTASGRRTEPFDASTKNTKPQDQWLVRNALKEAEARGDKFNALQFKGELDTATKSKKYQIPQSSKDSAEQYLFGEQPEVAKPFTRELMSSREQAPNKVINTASTDQEAQDNPVTAKPLWKMSRDEFKKELPDRQDSDYDRTMHTAWSNDQITRDELNKSVIRNSMGNKENWAKTRKELKQEKKDVLKGGRAARAETNKNPLYSNTSAKWANKAVSLKAKESIASDARYYDALLEAHKERVQEAIAEGKPVPQEVLADYPDLKVTVNETPTETLQRQSFTPTSSIPTSTQPPAQVQEAPEVVENGTDTTAIKEAAPKTSATPDVATDKVGVVDNAAIQNNAKQNVAGKRAQQQTVTTTPENSATKSPTPLQENAPLAGAGEGSDANIGREWDSDYGRQRIIGTHGKDTGFGKLYEAKSLSDGSIRRYSERTLEDTIKKQEYNLTPEYAKENADREERNKIHQNNAAKQKEKEEKELITINDFAKNLTPMQKGKVVSSLSKRVNINNKVDTLRNHIHNLVDGGETTSTREENKIKEKTRTQFNRMDNRQQAEHERKIKEGGSKTVYNVGGYDLGKTAYDYANHLIANKSEQAKQATTVQPEVVEGEPEYSDPKGAPRDEPEFSSDSDNYNTIHVGTLGVWQELFGENIDKAGDVLNKTVAKAGTDTKRISINTMSGSAAIKILEKNGFKIKYHKTVNDAIIASKQATAAQFEVVAGDDKSGKIGNGDDKYETKPDIQAKYKGETEKTAKNTGETEESIDSKSSDKKITLQNKTVQNPNEEQLVEKVDEEVNSQKESDRPMGETVAATKGSVSASQQTVNSTGNFARRKPKNELIFTKPITGKNGNQVLSYKWNWREGEKVDPNDGGLVNSRVSDWDSAITNPETGKDIVHQFNVKLTSGEEKTVSLETAKKMLGDKNLLKKVSSERNQDWHNSIKELVKNVSSHKPKDVQGKYKWNKYVGDDVKLAYEEVVNELRKLNINPSDRQLAMMINKFENNKSLNDSVRDLQDFIDLNQSNDKPVIDQPKAVEQEPVVAQDDKSLPGTDKAVETVKEEKPKFSKTTPQDVNILKEYAKDDEIFRYPVSDKNTIQEIMSEVDPSINFVGKQVFGSMTRYTFSNELDQSFFVIEQDDKVWIDVSDLTEGSRGSAIYAATGNYAANTGKFYIGDPEGLTNAAVIARNKALLSLALKYGRVDFLGSSKEQAKGILSQGVKPLAWEGSYVDKVSALIDTVTSHLYNNYPKLNAYKYDFDNEQFEDRLGRPLRPDWDKRLTDERALRTLRAGRATLRQGVFLKSIISSTSSEKSELLERIREYGNLESAGRRGIKGIFSKTKETPTNNHTKSSFIDAMRAKMDKEFGKGWMGRLLSTDKVQIVNTLDDIPADVKSRIDTTQPNESIQAFFDPTTQTTFFISENISKDKDIKKLMMHEISVHALKLGKNDAEFKSILKELNDLRETDKDVQEAFSYIPENTAPEDILEEISGYLLEHKKDLPITQRIIAYIRSALRRMAKIFPMAERSAWVKWANALSVNDIYYIANASLKSAPELLNQATGTGDNILKSAKQQDYEQTVIDQNISLTPQRVGDILREFAFGDTKTKAFVAYVNPDDFLRATTSTQASYENIENEATPLDLERIRNEKQNITLSGELTDGQFVTQGHQGRHRMVALRNAGIKQVPVVFQLKSPMSLKKMPSVKVSGQYNLNLQNSKQEQGKSFSVTNAIPVSYLSSNSLKSQFRGQPGQVMFSKSDNIKFSIASDINDAIKNAKKTNTMKTVSRTFDNFDSKARDNFYALTTGRQLVELGKDSLVELQDYQDTIDLMNKSIEVNMQKSDKIAKDWEQLVPYSSIPFKDSAQKEENADQQKKLAKTMSLSTIYNQDPRVPYAGKDDNIEAKKEYKEITDLYKSLNEKAQKVFTDVLNDHKDHMNKVKDALISNINMQKVSAESKQIMIDDIKNKMKETGIYFPLSRFGNYLLYYEEAGVKYFELFQSERELNRAIKENPGIKILNSGVLADHIKSIDGVSSKFMDQMDKMLEGISNPSERNTMRDNMYQAYLKLLPDISARKHGIHRTKMAGYHEDALRGYATKAFHDAKLIGRLQYREKLNDHLKNMQEAIDTVKNVAKLEKLDKDLELLGYMLPGSPDVPSELEQDRYILHEEYVAREPNDVEQQKLIKRDIEQLNSIKEMVDKVGDRDVHYNRILKELKIAYEHLMNPEPNPLSTALSGIGFLNYLGFAPSAAIVNSAQVAVVSLPYMASRHGWQNSTTQLNRAYREFFKGRNEDNHYSMQSFLTGNDAKAFNEALNQGILTRTLAMNLIDIGEEGVSSGSLKRKILHGSAYMFSRAEQLNREVTFMSAFRMEYAKNGNNFEKAVAYGKDIVNTTHGDYNNANAPRIMRGDVARVLTQFKKYSQMVMFNWTVAGLDVIGVAQKRAKGIPLNEEDKQAVNLLVGMAGMQIAAAGVMGLPIGGLMVVLQAAANLGGDDDEPIDVEAAIKEFMYDHLPDAFNINDALVRGPLTAWTGVDFQSRLNQSDLLFREPDHELEGKYGMNYIYNTLLGPLGGMAQNIMTAIEMFNDGYTMKGVEKILPKSLKDPLTAIRFINDGGATNMRNDVIEDINLAEAFAKLVGFTPAALSLKYDENFIKTRLKNDYVARYRHLMDVAARAKIDGDTEGFNEIWTEIDDWNKTNPNLEITRAKIDKSVKQRKAQSQKMESGFLTDKRLKDKTDLIDFTN